MIDIERVIKVVDWLIFEKIVKSRKDLALKMGYTESSMSQILNQKVPLSERFIKKLSILDDRINIDWVMGGDGDMLQESIIANDLDIKKIREELGISQEKLAEMIGVSPRTIQNWEAGNKIPSSKHAILRGLMPKEQTYYGGEDEFEEVAEPRRPEEERLPRKLIPFYDDVSTIGGINQLGANMDAVTEPTEYIDAGDWFRDATAAIRHYGESMVEYPTGCILALKEVQNRELIVPGRDYVVETSEYRVTKRIQKGNEPGYITAYSTNQETYMDGRLIHEPFDIPLRAVSHIYLVLGYVVKKNGETMLFNKR